MTKYIFHSSKYIIEHTESTFHFNKAFRLVNFKHILNSILVGIE